MKVLVVWEEIPEMTYFVRLEVDESQEDVLKLFHGNYINGEFDDISERISKFFYKDIEWEDIKEHGESNFKFKKEQEYIESEKFDLIIRTGIIK